MTRNDAAQNLEEPALGRARLLLAYDGSQFHGFADNVGVRTVAGVVTQALRTMTQRDITITGAGRTDAGVHAWGQVVSVDLPAEVDLEALPRRLTKMCAPGIVVRSAQWVDTDFDARFSAQWRRYRYVVLNEPVGDPLAEASAWWVAAALDLPLMRLACDPVIGEHDFTSFCRQPPVDTRPGASPRPPSMHRRVLEAHWTEFHSEKGQRFLRFDIQATAFCHQMVRSIVGTLVDVGLHRLTPGSIREILLARDRSRAGQVAPPQGLTLWEVGYGHDDGFPGNSGVNDRR